MNDKQASVDAKARKIELINNVLENKIESFISAIVKRSSICKVTIDEMNNNDTFKNILTNDRNFTNHLNIDKMICITAEQDADINHKFQSDSLKNIY